MAFIIPTPDSTEPRRRQRTEIEGREYVFVFDWNAREAKWSLSLYDQDESAIVTGIKLVIDFPLIRTVSDSRAPSGDLFVTSDGNEDPTLDTLKDFVLVYITQEEIDAAV